MAAMKFLKFQPCLKIQLASRLPFTPLQFTQQCSRHIHQHNTKCGQSLFTGTTRWSLPAQSQWTYPVRRLWSGALLAVRREPGGVQRLVWRPHGTGPSPEHAKANKTALIYICAVGVFMIGAAYAGVPLYRIFCQATGRGGQAVAGHDASKVETMKAIKDRTLVVKFNADVASSMQWNFRPQQTEVRVLPGETALAFYTARNPTNKPIIGISTYNVVPFEAGAYFNKIQCFCFEEQRLNPHEQVDMPVFFYIDPEFAQDPRMETVDQITLSYTFFESKEGLTLPLPGYVQPQPQPQT